MKDIFKRLESKLNAELKYDVKLNYSDEFSYLYFYENKEIVYLINLTLLHRATLILDVEDLSLIIKLVLISRGLM